MMCTRKYEFMLKHFLYIERSTPGSTADFSSRVETYVEAEGIREAVCH